MTRFLPGIILLSLAPALAGCGGSGTPASSTPPPPAPTNATKIKHIVVIMQENRSFDNLFNGFPGADTVQSGSSHGVTVPLQPIPFEQGTDIDHSHTGWYADLDGGAMDGFAHDAKYPIPNLPYAFVPKSETKPYWQLASTFTLGDRMFQSNSGPSFPAHQYMIAGQSQQVSENPNGPWGCDGDQATDRVALLGPNGTDLPGIFPCLDYQTMGDVMDAKGVSWRYYAPALGTSGQIWSAFQAIRHIRYGADWTNNVISPPPQVLTDIANGQLAQMTWIVPAFSYSDHASAGLTSQGADWVASITNAIGASQFWDSTVVFIAWDDWGGWYDHVVPPNVDAMGLGFRVPLLIVSPYAKHGYISHIVHEPSGFLRYAEETFTLPTLGQRDTSADDFADCFDYTQTPQPYVQIPVTFNPKAAAKLDASVPPDND